MSRTFVGLSFGSSLEGIDAAVVRVVGIGLGAVPRLERTARLPMPASVREEYLQSRVLAEAASQAVRHVVIQSGCAAREVFAVGLLEPAHPVGDRIVNWPEVADCIAEITGLTVVHGFRGRDRAAGGSGHPITAASDFLVLRSEVEDRLLIHLGAVSSVLFIPANAKVQSLHGFETGPGSQLLDSILFHGTRGKELTDPGGKKAVQGRCLEPLLTRWLEHPHLTRKPPKAVHPEAFGRAFLHGVFDAARDLGAGLPDLLCTISHFITRSIGEAWRGRLPAGVPRVLVSGGGVRNGFLWQLLGQQFEGTPIARTDEAGLPATARKSAAAAILATLTCDGVPGNLAPLTGAVGGRVLGQVVPGDSRNWARCTAWLAEQAGDYSRAVRAA